MADCSITAAQQAASDAGTKKALDASQAAGTSSKLDAMAAHTQAVMNGAATAVLIPPVPFFVKKKHDVINFFLSKGLKGQAVVEAMASKGFKIKLADVNANIKYYGTDKIPANFPKAGMITPAPAVAPTPKPITSTFVPPAPAPSLPAIPASLEPPAFISKKHDLINFYLGKGIDGQDVVNAMATKGFKIKVADVNANKKYYGTEKIPGKFAKAGGPAAPTVAQPMAQPSEDESFIMHKQVGPQKGSNPGGMYEDKDGTKRYVKLYAEEGQGIGEKVANEIYRRLGHLAPESQLFTRANGKKGFASKIIENEGTLEKLGLTKERALKVLDGFAADVLTANWDAVGLALDNIVILKGGQLARIDQGGSLLFRAKGSLKPPHVLGQITEWESFASTTNPAYLKIFKAAEISKIEELGDKLIKQIDDIKKLRDSLGANGWRGFLHQLGVPATHANKIAAMLESRTQLLIQKSATIKAAAEHAEQMKKLMEQASKNGLVHMEIPSSAVVPANAISVQTKYGYDTTQIIVSKPPAEIIAGKAESIAKWYGKHLPQATVDQVSNAITKLGHYTGGFTNVEAWMFEGATGKALSKIIPVKPGYIEDHNATQVLDKKHAALRNTLASSHISALKSYGGSGYGAINEALRRGESPYQSNPAGRIRALDNAMKTSTLDANVVLYRGLGPSHPLNQMSLIELQKSIGSEFTELAYGSHSTAFDRALGFSSRQRVIRVHAPHTTHGVWMRGAGAGVPTEQEFLMHRSSRFRIVSVSGNASAGGSIVIDVELIAQDAVKLKDSTASSKPKTIGEKLDELADSTPGLTAADLQNQYEQDKQYGDIPDHISFEDWVDNQIDIIQSGGAGL
jgi:hypothetical protein